MASLNEAHQQQRKAEGLLKNGKYEEAIECHQKAADLLQDAMKLTTVDKALESIRFQRDFHIRQQAVVRYRQRQVEKLSKAIQKKKLETNQDSEETVLPDVQSPAEDLQCAIYRTMEENDSLLQFLINKTDRREGVVEKTSATQDENPKDDIISSGFKMPKNEGMLIEELRVNNEEMRRLIQQLVFELDKSHQENQNLCQKISDLRLQLLDTNYGNYDASSSKSAHLKVITDSSSPFVISPCSELSPVGLRELPPLAPLEMPTFEFNLLKSDSSEPT